MKIRKHILLCIFIAFSSVLHSQTRVIDSLLHKINTSKNNNQKLTDLLLLFEQHHSIQKDTLLQYAMIAQQLATQSTKVNKGLAQIAFLNAQLRFNITDTVLKIIAIELPKYNAAKQTERNIYFQLAQLKSEAYNLQSDYVDAAEILYTKIKFAEKYKDTANIAISYNSLGEIAYNRNQLDESLYWLKKAILITKKGEKYTAQNAVSYINLAGLYNWLDKIDSAKYYIDLSIPICKKIDNLYYLCYAYLALSDYYKKNKQYKEAEYYMLEAMSLREKTEGKIIFSNEQLALGNLYYRSRQYDKAIQVFKSGIAYDDSVKQFGKKKYNAKSNLEVKQYYYKGLAKCYKATNRAILYGEMLEKFIATNDTLNQLNAASAMAAMQVQYETQKKENTIIQQQLDLSKKNNLIYSIIGSIVALAIIFIILFWSYKSKQELKLQQQIEEDKWQTQQEVAKAEENERSRIAADLHDNLGVYAASIASNLSNIQIDNENKSNRIALNELRNNSQSIVTQLNDTIWVLQKNTILLTAISDRIKLLTNRTQKSFPSIQFNITEDIEDDILFTASNAYQLYRIMQEAINNALKHSQCTQINIKIVSNKKWTIEIHDNGIGIDTSVLNDSNTGNGLKNMTSRAIAANWNIKWKSDLKGTFVIISPTIN